MIKHLFRTIWTALRSFAVGVGAGMLAAPHSGEETRRLMRERVLSMFDRISGYQQPHTERAPQKKELAAGSPSSEPIAQAVGAAQPAAEKTSAKASAKVPSRSNPRATTRTAAGATAKSSAKSNGSRKPNQASRSDDQA